MAEIKKKKAFKEKELKPASNSGKKTTMLTGKAKEAKAILKDLGKLPQITPEETTKLLQAIALGLVPDRFGMEVSLDTRLKAIQILQQNANEQNKSKQDEVLIVDDTDD